MALNGAVSNVDRVYVSVLVYERLHGLLNPESSTLASILMMELKVVGKDICKVEFLMQFKALREDQPDPNILDMMPPSSWDFRPPKQKLNDASMSEAYEITSAIAFSPRQRTKHRGPDTVSWTTNGDAVFPLVKPAVLISRHTKEPFLVECRIRVERDRSGSSSQDRRKPELRILSFRVEPPPDTPAVAGALAPYPNNLEYIMQDLKKAGPVSASALVKLDNEGLRCLAMLSIPEQQLFNVSQLLKGELLESVQWLLKDTVYNDWLSGRGGQPESQLLWIHGRRGQGKSTLAAFVTQSLQQEPHGPAQQPAIFVAYYFHEQKVSRWPEMAEVLRTLIHRLILQLPDLIGHLLDVFKEPDVGSGLFSNPDKLWKVIQAIISDHRVQVAYFIVDTSGNCDELLIDLQRNLESLPVSPKAKWLLFSRDSPVAEAAFSTAFKIDLNAKGFDYANKRDAGATGPNKLSEVLQYSIYEPALSKMFQTAEDDIKKALKSILAVMAVACGPVSFHVLEILSDSVKKVANDRITKSTSSTTH
ncbi:hypothetical protein N656DRAFT_409994 [Canariomyces notabilis]|uniref:Nephrocystin 3-like N-terminal domain-containing protein n=1 Tax=Canariomyces notabilis TaxID=2074819 RepID=A0AAN6TL50_9PEZI|nr:hypothetical protein N656DRAFT_409994 [Canariomyces arenarius]